MKGMSSSAREKPRVAVVLGPWSSGTSAVAGAVAALGANAHPPFVRLNDPRTKVSYESRALRQIFGEMFDHKLLARIGTPRWIDARLRVWAGPGLSVAKVPMLTWFLPEVMSAWDARFVIVRRGLEAIEATRERRGWPSEYGRKGAERIYSLIRDGLPGSVPRLEVDFDTLLGQPVETGDRLATFLDLPLAPERVTSVIRRG